MMKNEFIKIINAEIFHMPGLKGGKVRGLSLTCQEQENRLSPNTHSGFIWIDENSARDLGLVPKDHIKMRDDSLNEWIKENLTNQKLRIKSNIKLK